MNSQIPLKPFKSYKELVNILEYRGMIILDKPRAERKIAQVGYYRLSGYWHTCRKIKKDATGKYIINPNTKIPEREDTFQENINFNDIFDLYLFDKKLRLLMMDAIERIEIYIRTVIAHEMGKLDPLAYKKDIYIDPVHINNGKWAEWLVGLKNKIFKSRETCIVWYKSAYVDIPFWVAIEAWDFGALSKYYSFLKQSHQNHISKKLNINNSKILGNWLREINTLRNRCAHHTRIWNQGTTSQLLVIQNEYFNRLGLKNKACRRAYGLISILWFLVKEIGPNSEWIKNIADVIDSKPKIPACPYTAIGFEDNKGFPRLKFDI